MIDFKGIKSWLLASLAVNLFLLGYVVSGLLQPKDMPPPPPSPVSMLDRMSENLSPAGQAVLRDLVATNGAKLEELHGAMMAARMRVRDVFAKEPFDSAAFQAAQSEAFAAAQAFFQALGEVIGETGVRLSAEDRQRLRPFNPPSPR